MPFFNRTRIVPCVSEPAPCVPDPDPCDSEPAPCVPDPDPCVSDPPPDYPTPKKKRVSRRFSDSSVQIDLKPVYRSPIDNLGYPERCCCCIPLRLGVAIICLISFIFAFVELARSEKTILGIFPDKKQNSFRFAKLTHIIIITVYLLSCGVLLIGIITSKYKAINLYVWVALIFNCICIVVIVASLGCQVVNTGMTKRIAMMGILSIAWYSAFFYYISVVNSYKYRLFGAALLRSASM